jgi:signal transduction histidine kinase
VQLCRYGVNYWRVSEELLVAGIVVRDYRPSSDAHRKMVRRIGTDAIRVAELVQVVERATATTAMLERDLARQRRRAMNRYRRSKGYQRDVVEQLRPELQRTFGQVHDYKQFVQQVIQNLDVHLDKRLPGLPMEEKVAKASHEETAIYWAARLMDEKLDASVLVLDPGQIADPAAQRVFRFHGLVTKYVRIYQRRIDERGIRLHELGGSFVDVRGNPRAIGIIPHALIDNAVKYASAGSEITISYAEDAQHVTFRVQSLGPRILEGERTRIFDFYYRGEEAQKVDSGGAGFGLAAAQLVAHAMDTNITVEQSSSPAAGGGYLTTFCVAFPVARAAAVPQEARLRPGRQGARRRGQR